MVMDGDGVPVTWPHLLYDNGGYGANFSSIIPDSTSVPIIPKIIPT